MLIHSVYFNFNSSTSEDEKKACIEAAKGLGAIEYAKAYYVGTHAAVAERPPLVKDYDFALTGVFESVADHDAYQLHSIHTAFIGTYKPLWERVRVFDFD
tara:strand:+ start:700 stop:999 length:300 start_codon:yes stop_codon:yes gene_type:complete